MQAWRRFIGRIKWRLPCVVVPLAFALALLASPASAIVIRLANGKMISYEAVAGAKAPKPFDDFFSNMDYSGGPIMPSNTNYTIVWQPAGYAGAPFQSAYTAGVNQYFTDLAHDSGQATNSESVLTQYNDAAGQVATYQSFNGGLLTDTHALPPNGCPVNGAHPICVTDAQIQTELSNFLAAQGLHRDLTHEYFLLTPPGVASCFDSSAANCSANTTVGSSAYCAYHSASTTPGGSFIYSSIPDLAGVPGCDPYKTPGSGFCPATGFHTCNYNNGFADGVLNAISHEHGESVTDPQPNNGWTDWGSNSSTSFGSNPQELGDVCNNDGFLDPNLQLQPLAGNYTPFNYTINGHHYLLQRMWGNQGHACAHSFISNGTAVHASFTQTASSGDSVSFDASASTLAVSGTQYVWQFNDGPSQQTSTFETTSPSTSWTFPSPGPYQVALTVMAPDGTSNGTAHTVYAVTRGPNPAFVPPAAYAGVPTRFNGGGSSDPNPVGGIVTYSWDFGDGTTGSGRTAGHTYSRTGFYTVTLTVQDNYFAVASVSRSVTVSRLPGASFTPRSGRARHVIHFHATGPSAPGTIVGYRWKFGDGATGHGSHPAHRYAHAGKYKVRLTITYSNGTTSSVTIWVAVRSSRHHRH
ncbi:MAG: PKD domain-containing protein [Actinomycetota bacterium]|nr:PKD domain-containing protein [Actinomycetota bacterium]